MEYAMKRTTDEPMDEVEKRVREALAEEGFGILTEIDVQATLKTKIDVDRPAYKILGACNPTFANQALEAAPDLGVLLPCNVCLYEDNGTTVVSAMKPTAALGLVDNPTVSEIGHEVEKRVWRALERAVPKAVTVSGAAETS
jgi:uncharacterized protein (DUF302 family)